MADRGLSKVSGSRDEEKRHGMIKKGSKAKRKEVGIQVKLQAGQEVRVVVSAGLHYWASFIEKLLSPVGV